MNTEINKEARKWWDSLPEQQRSKFSDDLRGAITEWEIYSLWLGYNYKATNTSPTEEQPTVTAEEILEVGDSTNMGVIKKITKEEQITIYYMEDGKFYYREELHKAAALQYRSLPGLKQIASDAWDAGINHIYAAEYGKVPNPHPDKETYLKQFNK